MYISPSALVTAVLLASVSPTWSRFTDAHNNLQEEEMGNGRFHEAEFSRRPFASKYAGQVQKGEGAQKLLGNVQGILESVAAQGVIQSVLDSAPNMKLTCKPNITCDPTQQFRNADGSCNNLAHPDWGRVGSCMRRELPPAYADGMSSLRTSVSGGPLPSALLVSTVIHSQKRHEDILLTNISHVFGQLVSSDISLVAPRILGPLETDPGPDLDPTCLQGPECIPIEVPENDVLYTRYNVTLLGMKRTQPCSECGRGPRNQMNQQTSYIDLSPLYGHNDQMAKVVRKYRGGLLRSQEFGGAEYLPTSSLPYIDNCSVPEQNHICNVSGDILFNQLPGMLSLKTLWMREHNRFARALALINKQWNDEQLFQTTRRIVEGRYQHILYSEWLPGQLGPNVMGKYDLWPRQTGRTSYNDEIDATVANEVSDTNFHVFSTAVVKARLRAYRQGKRNNRTTLRGNITSINPNDFYWQWLKISVGPRTEVYGTLPQRATGIRSEGILGLSESGDFYLDATAVQRGRDHGLPTYVDMVRLCQNITIANFSDLTKVMATETAKRYPEVYGVIHDVDLYSGGLLEPPLEGAQLGATLACSEAKQFHRLKYGDRFYYENANQTGSFTEEQLDTIRNSTMASVLCNNLEGLEGATFNRNAFLRLTNGSEGVTCGDLPDIDLSKWGEEDSN